MSVDSSPATSMEEVAGRQVREGGGEVEGEAREGEEEAREVVSHMDSRVRC